MKRVLVLTISLINYGLVFVFVPATWAQSSPRPPLLQQSDLRYQGAFRVPDGEFGGSRFGYGGTAPAFNPLNNSLFIVGHAQEQQIAEISIPDPVDSDNIEDLPIATVLQAFTNLLGRIPSKEEARTVGGLLVVNNQLYGTLYEFYDAAGDATLSHFRLSSLNLENADVTGLFRVGAHIGAGFVAGYMAEIPPEWQDNFGVPYITGQAALSIISRTSAGPAALGFDPAALGATPAAVTPMVYYPLDYPLAPEDTQNPLFNLATSIDGVLFARGYRSLVFFGSHGIGPYCYGTGQECNDPVDESKGTHAYPYIYQAWAYDVEDLILVKNGVKEAWEVQPYEIWNIELPFSVGYKQVGGIAYDWRTGRVYLSQMNGDIDGEPKPIIHVFELSSPSPEPDNAAPLRFNGSPNGNLPSGTTSATLALTTNETCHCRYSTIQGMDYSSMVGLFSTTEGTSHSSTISGLSDGNSYSYYVRCQDTVGNTNSDDYIISFRVASPQESIDLVAAYSFDEGGGNSVADVTLNNNNGAISGASWSSEGKFGNALLFDGIDDWVTINDASSLDLSSGLTLEAWVYPTVPMSGWKTVIQKEQPGGAVYYLHGSSDSNQPATGVFIKGGEQILAGGTSLAVNSWTHIAATYDGTMHRLFINGSEVKSQPQTGEIKVSSNPLRIGGNSVWGEYFEGLIDEVRIYNRPLTAKEIQTDMVTPVISDIVTPVELVSFQASVNGAMVSLHWQMASNTNNLGFEILKSNDDETYESVGFVKGQGTSLLPQHYSFTEKVSKPGRYFYRLKQVNLDGTSQIVGKAQAEVKVPEEYELHQNYPNPFNPSTLISYVVPKEGRVLLAVYSLLGERIKTLVDERITEPGFKEVWWDGRDDAGNVLPSGIYFYRLEAASQVLSHKMILMQ